MQVGDLVAVYGTLRHMFGNHRRLEGATRQEDGQIVGQYRMVSLGGCPGLVKDGELTGAVVEIYEIDTDARIRSLDQLEGYPSFYDREVVTLEDGRECWVYFLDAQRWGRHETIDSGDWAEHMKKRGVRW